MHLNNFVASPQHHSRRLIYAIFLAALLHVTVTLWYGKTIDSHPLKIAMLPSLSTKVRFTEIAPIKEKTKETKPPVTQKIVERAPITEKKQAIIKPTPQKAIEQPRQQIKEVESLPPTPPAETYTDDLIIPVITNAKVIGNQVPPKYPPRAKRMGIEGTTLLRALVNSDGHTEEVLVHKSSGFSALDHAAARAIWKWEFQPAEKHGTITKTWVEVPITFQLTQR